MSIPCTHLDQIHPVTPRANGCEACLAMGDRWVHLRLYQTCAHRWLKQFSLVRPLQSCVALISAIAVITVGTTLIACAVI